MGLKYELYDLAAFRRLPRNPKDHSLDLIHQSVDRFGFIEPVVVNQTTGHLIAGHGRVAALQQRKAAGKSPPDNITVRDGQWLVPTAVVVIAESEEEAASLALNRLTEVGGWHEDQLAGVLSDLAAQGEQALAGIGYSANDLDDMLRMMEVKNFTRPEFGGVIERFGEEERKSQKDGNWFYVEFYGDDGRFGELSELLEPHLVTKHEVDKEFFHKLVKGAKDDAV